MLQHRDVVTASHQQEMIYGLSISGTSDDLE